MHNNKIYICTIIPRKMLRETGNSVNELILQNWTSHSASDIPSAEFQGSLSACPHEAHFSTSESQ